MTNAEHSDRYEALLQRSVQTVRSLKARIEQLEQGPGPVEPIAVVGMGCRFPGGGDSPEAFFDALMTEVDAVTRVPSDRWTMEAGSTEMQRACSWGAFVDDVFRFDAAYFGISDREAAAMDPQQRMTLEVVHDAVTHAGYRPRDLPSQTGVFLGLMNCDYIRELMRDGVDALDLYATTGNGHCFLPGRVSYQFGWSGPSLAVDTACSSSLVAVDLACESLRTRTSDVALAGGVHLMLSPQVMAMTAKTGTLSPEGRCRTFDARANGIVRGEGCGVIVLKRLRDAKRDGDAVLALIRGTGVNQDGRSTNLTAPNVLAQEALMRSVVARAGVHPRDVAYLETHGTGTPLGDPIEVEAIQQVYGLERSAPCVLGAVKTNIGHLEAAAGIAGLIKAIVALRRGVVPPNLHFRRLNPRIELSEAQWTMPTAATPLSPVAGGGLAAVSSFGLSGTNAHVLVQGCPADPSSAATRHVRVLPLAASSMDGVVRLAKRWRGVLDTLDSEAAVDDAVWTASAVERPGAVRIAVVAESRLALRNHLTDLEDRRAREATHHETVGDAKLAFLFTGQGAQYPEMGAELIAREPVFRTTLERCDALLADRLGRSLFDLLGRDGSALDDTRITQPVLFALELAAYTLWQSWGIVPDVLLGHSLGEYVAAHVAGVWSLEDALELVCWRGALMQETPRGAMLSLQADEARVRALIDSAHVAVDIAAVNTCDQVVVAGAPDAVAEFEAVSAARGVSVRRLRVTRAFHSAQMDPILDAFEDKVSRIQGAPPSIPVIGNVHGREVERFDATYLRAQLRHCVRFADGLKHAFEAHRVRRFVELGPHPVLCGFGASTFPAQWVPSMRKGEPADVTALRGLAALYEGGYDVDFRSLYATPRRRVPQPPSVWEGPQLRRRPRSGSSVEGLRKHALLGQRLPVPGGIVHWVRSISARDPEVLGEHRVFDRPVMPGAMALDLMLCAARELGIEGGVSVEALTFDAPLVLNDEDTRMTVTATPVADGWTLVIHVAIDGRDDRFQEVARAEVRPNVKDGPAVDVADVRSGCAGARPIEPLYAALEHGGVVLGMAFRRIAAVHESSEGVLAELAAPDDGVAEWVRTVALDACLHSVGLTLPAGTTQVFVPARIRAIDYHRPDVLPAWAYATPATDGQGAQVQVFGRDGALVAALRGVELTALDALAIEGRGEHSFWDIRWSPIETLPPVHADTGWWLVLEGDRDEGEVLVEALGDVRCMRVARPSHPSAIVPVLDAAAQRVASRGGMSGIVYGWHLGADTEEDPLDHQRWAVVGASQCAQWMLGRDSSDARLWLVTRGAVAHGNVDDVRTPEDATLWGLARTLVQEHPQLRVGAIDLDPSESTGVQIARTILRGHHSEDQILIRNERVHVARLAPLDVTPSVDPRDDLRMPGTHLVTGGCGGLGRSLCEWLLAHGADRLVVVTHRPLDEGRRAWLAGLRDCGATVAVETLDVAHPTALRRVIEREADTLRGVFHLAGSLDDGAFRDLTPARFEAVLRAKMGGAWNLHVATASLPLRHFVLYGSVASLLGSPGQANYAAANAYLDALASYRRTRGLVATSLDWGAVVGGQMKVREDSAFARAFRPIAPDEALRDLGLVLGMENGLPPQIGILPFVPRTLQAQLPSASSLTLMRDLWTVDERPPSGDRGGLLRQLAMVPSGRRSSDLLDWLRRFVAEAKHIPRGAVATDAPLSDLGIDSLMGIELRSRLERELDAVLPASLLFGASGLEDLADEVIARIEPATSAPVVVRPGLDLGPDTTFERFTEAQLAGLDETESERLLLDRLRQLEGGLS